MRVIFGNPYVLLASPLIAAALAVLWLRARRERRVLEAVYGYAGGRLKPFLDAAKVAALALIIVAASEPVLVFTKRVEIAGVGDVAKYSAQLPVHAIILVDVSPSMHREGRLQQAAAAVSAIVSALNTSDIVTLAVFGGEVRHVYTGNVTGFKVPDFTSYVINYTSITAALGWARSQQRVLGLPAAVFVITDGVHNFGGDPVEATRSLNASGIPVVYVKAGEDPRSKGFFTALKRLGFTVIEAEYLDETSIKNLLLKAVLEAKYEAVVSSGRSYVEVEERVPVPISTLALASLALLVASRIEGV